MNSMKKNPQNKKYKDIKSFFETYKHCLVCGKKCRQELTSSTLFLEYEKLSHMILTVLINKEPKNIPLKYNDGYFKCDDVGIDISRDFKDACIVAESYCTNNSVHDFWGFSEILKIYKVNRGVFKLKPFTINYESLSYGKYTICNFNKDQESHIYSIDGDLIAKTKLINLNKITEGGIDKLLLLL